MLTHNALKITERSISLPRLPAALEGFRIVQISDLHFYEYTDPRYYDRVVAAVNDLNPDVIALTGDIVHYGDDHIDLAASFLRRLEAREARLAILGNHDYYDGAWGQNITVMLGQTGFGLLKNTHRRIERNGESLYFAGLDDLWHGAPDLARALEGIPAEDAAIIVLAHNPLLFDPVALACEKPVDLVISGHTHAGHVYIPILGPIYRKIFRMKYRYGLFEKNGCRLHVSSGVGSAAFYLKKQKIGFPRFRFNTHPEIALLTLRPDSSS